MASKISVHSERGKWLYQASPSFVQFQKVIDGPKSFLAFECHGPRWVLGLVTRKYGKVTYRCKSQNVVLEQSSWAFFYPQFSIAFGEVDAAHLDVEVISARCSLGKNAPLVPSVFRPPQIPFPETLAEVASYISMGTHFQSVNFCADPCWVSGRAKDIIDSSYGDQNFSIGSLRSITRVSSAQLARTFKEDFGISPVQYRNHLRVISSLESVLNGERICDVSNAVGYNDLSRFNKNFRKVLLLKPTDFQA